MKKLICLIVTLCIFITPFYAHGAEKMSYTQTDYTAYIIKDGYKLELYEPEQGCYIGAYVLANKAINFDMEQFDLLSEKKHNSYVYNMRLDTSFPTLWVLECISQQKTPFITMNPPVSADMFDIELLEKAAKSFGEFYVPMFINFYPNPESLGAKSSDYIRFFKKAKEIFGKYASNVSFIWSVDIENVFGSGKYYPGDSYVNWVGINIFNPIYKNGEKNNADIYKRLDFFYNSYQFKKPIAVCGFASSHYSTYDHKYYVPQSVSEISNFYTSLKTKYPRIKSINYIDFNNVQLADNKTVTDNFSVTDDKNIFGAYKAVIKPDYFLSELSVIESGDIVKQTYSSAFKVYTDGAEFYIPQKLLTYELQVKIPDIAKKREVQINGVIHYRVSDLSVIFGVSASIDRAKQNIIIKGFKD